MNHHHHRNCCWDTTTLPLRLVKHCETNAFLPLHNTNSSDRCRGWWLVGEGIVVRRWMVVVVVVLVLVSCVEAIRRPCGAGTMLRVSPPAPSSLQHPCISSGTKKIRLAAFPFFVTNIVATRPCVVSRPFWYCRAKIDSGGSYSVVENQSKYYSRHHCHCRRSMIAFVVVVVVHRLQELLLHHRYSQTDPLHPGPAVEWCDVKYPVGATMDSTSDDCDATPHGSGARPATEL